jgi:prepilin-type processing-associated H-X9-DG protein
MLKVIALIALCILAIGAIYYALVQIAMGNECADHLRRIYHAMEMYETDRGTLPHLAFFPDNPEEDPDSLRTVLESYGVDGNVAACPAVADVLAELGLTYVWNTELNGRKLPGEGQRTWMLVDLNALSPDVPAPHMGRYNVLYTDGKVERVKYALMDLPGL